MDQRPQQLQLELIRHMSRLRLDGKQVAERNTSLWSAALTMGVDLVPFRDLSSGIWNADRIYLLSSQEDDDALFALVSRWKPDEADWIQGEDAHKMLGTTIAGGFPEGDG